MSKYASIYVYGTYDPIKNNYTIILGSLVPSEAVTSCYFGFSTAGTGSFVPKSCGGTYNGYCYKIYYKINRVSIVEKSCAGICRPGSGTYNGYSATYYCCTTDNCNFSSAFASNKYLTALSIMIATGLALFRSN